MPRLKVVVPDDEPDQAGEGRAEELRLLEAMLFASAEPLDEKSLTERPPQGLDLDPALLGRGAKISRPAGDLRHQRGIPVAFRARCGKRPAGARRAQRLGPARRTSAARVLGADAVR